MGCGKTTLGTALASLTSTPLIDLDEYIEQSCDATVKQIFERDGEEGFRRIEQECLRKVSQMKGVIVACGGGTPCFADNMDIMNDAGVTVWLTTSARRIASRLALPEQKAKRPLIAQLNDKELLEYVKAGMAAREPFYSRTQLRFDSTRLESERDITNTAKRLAKVLEATEDLNS